MSQIYKTIARLLEQNQFTFTDVHIEVGTEMRVRIPLGLIPAVENGVPVSKEDIVDFLHEFDSASMDEWQRRIDSAGGQHLAVFTVAGVRMRAALANCGGLADMKQRRWALAMRVLPKVIPAFEELGLPPEIKALYRRENGIIFVTGITGSGKSTTLASAIEEVNTNLAHRIITLEHPPEFEYRSKKSMVTQRELGVDFASYGEGVKQAMRQDPNIIVVGEVNDLESLRGAITAANSGHLVLATMHTVSAAATVNRVLDLYPEAEKQAVRSMFAQLLVAVVSQKLLPSKDGRRSYLAHEVMENNTAISTIIREGQLQRLGNEIDKRAPLLHLMNTSLAKLVREDRVSRDHAMSAAYDPEGLADEIDR